MEENERIKELKQLKKLANSFLNFYKSEKNTKSKAWENDLIERNISLLKQIVNKINKSLHPQRVYEYKEATTQTLNDSLEMINDDLLLKKVSKKFSTIIEQGSNIMLLYEINRCSPKMSYINDFTWFTHGTIKEQMDYGLGNVDETIFEKYLPFQINNIKELENSFFKKSYFQEDMELLIPILTLIKENQYISVNILIITLIEGLVRKFCFLVLKKQNPEKLNKILDFEIYEGKSSFESLIQKTTWKKDIPVKYSKFIIEYSHTEDPIINDFEQKINKCKTANMNIRDKLDSFLKLENKNIDDNDLKKIILQLLEDLKKESKDLMSEEDKTIMIGMDIYLDFLVKKFKDDRNNIIHGKYSFFKEKWKTLFYLTALETLANKITWYEKNIGFY